jgi:hypothetical protein
VTNTTNCYQECSQEETLRTGSCSVTKLTASATVAGDAAPLCRPVMRLPCLMIAVPLQPPTSTEMENPTTLSALGLATAAASVSSEAVPAAAATVPARVRGDVNGDVGGELGGDGWAATATAVVAGTAVVTGEEPPVGAGDDFVANSRDSELARWSEPALVPGACLLLTSVEDDRNRVARRTSSGGASMVILTSEDGVPESVSTGNISRLVATVDDVTVTRISQPAAMAPVA